ncbi:MAG: antitoxin Xre-like helix-turn-helix domain-containing protein, partial [Rhodanobacteraceae bacterium]
MKQSDRTKQASLEKGVATDDLVNPGLRTVFRIAQKWNLGNDDLLVLLGQPSRSTFFRWKAGHAAQASHD